jgi:PAS domain S-box-containing protein
MAALAVAGVAFVGGLTLWNGRAEAERDALVYVENHAQIVEEHARQAVREVVESLAVAVGFLETADLTAGGTRLDSFVTRIGTSSPRVDRFAIYDAYGQVIAGNGEDIMAETYFGPDTASRGNRFVVNANEDFVLVDLPYFGPGETRGGIVRAGISKSYFEEFYRTINIREGSDVGLALPSGEVLVRQGALYEAGDLPSPTVQLDADAEMHAMLVSVGGAERFEAYRRLPDIPVLIFSALDARAVFSPWWQDLRLFAIIIGLIAAPLLLLGRLIVRTQRRQRWVATIVESSREAIWSRTRDGHIASWNQGAEQLFGYSSEDIIGKHTSVLWRKSDAPKLSLEAEEMNVHGTHLFSENAIRLKKDGSEVSVAITGSPIRDATDRIIGAAITARDISEKREVEERLYRLAYLDSLVDLPNRAMLEEELAKAVQKSVSSGQPLAFHYLDLDHFKDVNDHEETESLDPIEAARNLLQRAEIALYEAKTAGRHRHSYYADHHGDRVRRKMEVRESLTRAIKSDALDLHFQPQVDLATGEIFGAEALVRWTDPVTGSQAPSEFIQIAEQSGLIVELGAWVMRRACMTQRLGPKKTLSFRSMFRRYSSAEADCSTSFAIPSMKQAYHPPGLN